MQKAGITEYTHCSYHLFSGERVETSQEMELEESGMKERAGVG